MAALASLMLLIPLSGCSSVESDTYDGMQNADCQSIDSGVWQCTVTMLDTRKVTCLVISCLFSSIFYTYMVSYCL